MLRFAITALALVLIGAAMLFLLNSSESEPTEDATAVEPKVERPSKGALGHLNKDGEMSPVAPEEPAPEEPARPAPLPIEPDPKKPLPPPRTVMPSITSELGWVQSNAEPLEDPVLNPDGVGLSDQDEETFTEMRQELSASVYIAWQQLERVALILARARIEIGEYQVVARGEKVTVPESSLGYVLQPLDENWSAMVRIDRNDPEIRDRVEALEKRRDDVLLKLREYLEEHGQ
ncbi:MAG: hypothetical protein RL885_12120 [Planctomycetota bacterium]